MGLKKKAEVAPVADENTETAEVIETPKASKKKAAPIPETPIQEAVEEQAEEVVQETVQETTEPTQEIAAPASTQVAQRAQGGVLAKAAEEGFEGLEIGFGSFPILKIDGESFDLDGEELEESSIHLQIMQSRTKWIIKQADKGENADFIYSYDKVNDTAGKSVATWVNNQKLDGNDVEYKQYIEAVAEVHEEGEFEGEMVILSIPPSGVKRFSGYVASLQMKKGVNPSVVVTKASVGKKIKKGSISWCPWRFTFVSMVD